jgi:hypothetical protein
MFNAVPAQTSLPLQHNRANPRISCAKKRRDDILFGGIQEAYKDFEVQMCGIQHTLNSYVWSRFVYNTYSMYYRYKPVFMFNNAMPTAETVKRRIRNYT